ncbi:hypothetical protein KSP40_PGU001180 [Platanthera guangdongensis]|uniref:Uncharacterized protein n=1 Tax=Platanthera guangdongensis TaxID=2320717 RepID=A0ABR2MGM8_9ASPA
MTVGILPLVSTHIYPAFIYICTRTQSALAARAASGRHVSPPNRNSVPTAAVHGEASIVSSDSTPVKSLSCRDGSSRYSKTHECYTQLVAHFFCAWGFVIRETQVQTDVLAHAFTPRTVLNGADKTCEERRISAFGVLSGISAAGFVSAILIARFLPTSATFQVSAAVAVIAAIYMRIFLAETDGGATLADQSHRPLFSPYPPSDVESPAKLPSLEWLLAGGHVQPLQK